MKPNHFNSIFRRLFQRLFVERQPVTNAEHLKHQAEPGRKIEFLGDNTHEACVIHTLGSPSENVVAALVASHAGDPSLLDELVKQGYVVGSFEELGKAVHERENRRQGFHGKRQLAANDGAAALLGNATDGGATFTILQPDGFFIPYGEYPHKQGLQKFERADALTMVANHNGMFAKLTRWAGGGSYPVYIGHPDIPGTKDTDKRSYGWIEGMVAESEGMRLAVKWSEPGRELVENAQFKFYSPAWWLKKSGKFMRPVGLKSMGLTNDPNIPVPALANEKEEIGDRGSETEEQILDDENNLANNEMTPELLAALGLDDTATPETAVAKITLLSQAAADLVAANERAEENAETLKAETLKVETAAAELLAANEAAVALETKLQLVANTAVQGAVLSGKITPAEVEAKVTELLAANDLEAALADLGKLPVKMKVASKTGDLGASKTRLVVAANDQSKAAREERATLVANEYANTNAALPEHERKRIAWERARSKNPEAFTQQSPESAA